MILLVGLVAGALIIAGLLVRRPVPKAESLPDRVLAATDGADR